MKINKKVLTITMIVICGAWVYNLIFFMENKFDKPLFFRQNSYVSEDGNVEIMYLGKVQPEEDIVSIQFPEIGNVEIRNMGIGGFGNGSIMFRKLGVNLSDERISNYLNLKGNLDSGDIIISKMRYTTSSGIVEDIDIGKITIGKKFEYKKEYKILEQLGGTYSNRSIGSISYKVKDDLEIIAIEAESIDNINKIFDVYINSELLEDITLPIKVEKNKAIEIYYEAKKGLNDNDLEFEQYNVQLKLKCSDPEGTIDYITTNLNYDLSMNNDVTKAGFAGKLKNRLGEN